MLLYGYVVKWKKMVVDWIAVLSVVGAVSAFFVAGDTVSTGTAFFVFGTIALVAGMLMLSPDMMETVRPVPDEFYKTLGAFDATVRNVAPHVVEVETDSGAVLFVDADRVPEVACFRGARVEADAAVVASPAGQGDVRADGADVAMGDEPRGKWNGRARFYAVTAVRAAD